MRGNPWYPAAAALAACGPVESGDQLRAVARALVLLGLEGDPKSVAELPRAWPITRAALRVAVAEATAARLCESVGDPLGRLRLTDRGRALLGRMRGRRSAA